MLVRESAGSVAADIIKVADDEEVDLILLSRSTKGTIEKVILGSVIEGVLGDSGRDVLIVP